MKNLIKLGLFLVAGILIYNYFYGTPSEKEKSEKIFTEFKDVGVSVVNLMKDEKEKYNEGKYDEAIEKMKGAVEQMKDKIDKSGDDSLKDEMDDLGYKSRRILDKWENNKPQTEAEKEKFESDMKKILEEAQNIFEN
jgi:ElaB/YqjD/DUF883 family membrane-anchored ribosome-binding protein